MCSMVTKVLTGMCKHFLADHHCSFTNATSKGKARVPRPLALLCAGQQMAAVTTEITKPKQRKRLMS